mgnify:CR=1 FL=1
MINQMDETIYKVLIVSGGEYSDRWENVVGVVDNKYNDSDTEILDEMQEGKHDRYDIEYYEIKELKKIDLNKFIEKQKKKIIKRNIEAEAYIKRKREREDQEKLDRAKDALKFVQLNRENRIDIIFHKYGDN